MIKNGDDINLLANDLYQIETSASPYPWTKQMFIDSLSAGHHVLLVKSDTCTAGFLIFTKVADEIDILNLAVHQDFQRKGFAKTLINDLFAYAKSNSAKCVYLEVRKSNTKAIKLYEKMGFAKVSIRRDYYRSNNHREDGLIYLKDIT